MVLLVLNLSSVCESAARFVSLTCPQLEGYLIDIVLTYYLLFESAFNFQRKTVFVRILRITIRNY